MNLRQLLVDAALSPVAGYLATKAMEPVSMKLYELESEIDRAREDVVRPGPPYRIAAEKTARLVGVNLTDSQLDTVALGFHHGLAVSWAPVYALLRRTASLNPLAAGLTTGAAMSLIVDVGLTPALGFSAPNREYPLATHLRGVVAHLVFGVAVAGVFEVGWGLLRQRP
ncbi:MAG: DUF1440 domain-containing protein [Actinomycetota bacterium]|nr:DUF1440 domain-containing protein [Actinomycetota bacterium]